MGSNLTGIVGLVKGGNFTFYPGGNMAEKKQKMGINEKREKTEEIRFGKINYLLLSLGVLFIAFGYLSLSRGSLTLAPIMLVVGYCVLIPFGIVMRGKKRDTL